MPDPLLRTRLAAITLAALALPACAGTYTGPVEVTRFVAANPIEQSGGRIAVVDESTSGENLANTSYRNAVGEELQQLGYSVIPSGNNGQTARITIQRERIDGTGRRSPVTVGGGGSTGSYGSGVGLGIGINLGGSGSGPRDVTQLSVRIVSEGSGETLWEGRAELVTSVDSPYAATQANANALAAALFKDFPGGNGETVTIPVDELEGTP